MNILEIIRKYPGRKWYCTTLGTVFAEEADTRETYCMKVTDRYGRYTYLTEEGNLYEGTGECILFPSREDRDWEAFARERNLHKGDMCMVSNNGRYWSLGYYSGNWTAVDDHERVDDKEAQIAYKHIIPIRKFNFGELEARPGEKHVWTI